MKKSTSLHSFSVDGERSLLKLLGYFPLNVLSNLMPHRGVPASLPVRPWVPSQQALSDTASSPTRVLSNLFWDQLPWQHIAAELGDIRVCDIGCGSGNYASRFQADGDRYITSYTGLDIAANPNWPKLSAQNPKVTFKTVDLNSAPKPIPSGTTLITSQSTLEHIEYDLQLFSRIAAFARETDHPLLQIHLVPSRACLPLYLFHGVRQYTPRSLSAAWRLFEPFSEGALYALGSPQHSKLHFSWITVPVLSGRKDKRQQYPAKYARKMAVIMAQNDTNNPCFYAFVILSNPRTALKNIFTSTPS